MWNSEWFQFTLRSGQWSFTDHWWAVGSHQYHGSGSRRGCYFSVGGCHRTTYMIVIMYLNIPQHPSTSLNIPQHLIDLRIAYWIIHGLIGLLHSPTSLKPHRHWNDTHDNDGEIYSTSKHPSHCSLDNSKELLLFSPTSLKSFSQWNSIHNITDDYYAGQTSPLNQRNV